MVMVLLMVCSMILCGRGWINYFHMRCVFIVNFDFSEQVMVKLKGSAAKCSVFRFAHHRGGIAESRRQQRLNNMKESWHS